MTPARIRYSDATTGIGVKVCTYPIQYSTIVRPPQGFLVVGGGRRRRACSSCSSSTAAMPSNLGLFLMVDPMVQAHNHRRIVASAYSGVIGVVVVVVVVVIIIVVVVVVVTAFR